MRVIFLMFCLFSIGFSVCNENNLPKISKIHYKKNNQDHKKEFDIISRILVVNMNNRLSKFDKDLKAVVQVKVSNLNEYCFKIIEYSKNNEFNKVLQNFLNEENGKIYIKEPIFKIFNIDLKP